MSRRLGAKSRWRSPVQFYPAGFPDLLWSHLADAAFFAMADRFFLDSDAARALPPFRPPRRPRATAAGFFSGSAAFGSAGPSPVTWSRMLRASWLTSLGLLERLGMLV